MASLIYSLGNWSMYLLCLISEVVSAALVSYDTRHPMLPLLLSIRNKTKLTKLNMQSREHLEQSFNFRVFIKTEFLFLVSQWDGAHVEKAISFKHQRLQCFLYEKSELNQH